jgi:ribonuclease D
MTIFLYKNDLPDGLNLGESIAVDTETMGLNVLRDRLCLIQISAGNGDAHLVQFELGKYDAPNLRKILADEKVLKIFHFARFDMATLQHYLGVEVRNIYCTKIASKLTRTYTESHGLKTLCEEILGVEISKKQQSSDWGSVELHEKQKEYAASDVLYLHRLKEKLDEKLKREDRYGIFQSCLSFLPTRVKLDLEGFPNVNIFAH